jgi:hypothetical protein
MVVLPPPLQDTLHCKPAGQGMPPSPVAPLPLELVLLVPNIPVPPLLVLPPELEPPELPLLPPLPLPPLLPPVLLPNPLPPFAPPHADVDAKLASNALPITAVNINEYGRMGPSHRGCRHER